MKLEGEAEGHLDVAWTSRRTIAGVGVLDVGNFAEGWGTDVCGRVAKIGVVEEVGYLGFVTEIEAFGESEVLACRPRECDRSRTGEDADRAVAEAPDVVARNAESSRIEVAVAIVRREVAGNSGAVWTLRRGHAASKDTGSRRVAAGEAGCEEVAGVIEENTSDAPTASK